MKTANTKTRAEFLVDRDAVAVVVPAGRYYLTDPCYAVRDEDWLPWLEAADYRNAGTLLCAELPGGFFAFGFSTAYGDGSWRGSDGFTYAADAGMIGLVPVEYAGKVRGVETFVNVVEFSDPTRCQRDADGVLHFGEVCVATAR